MLSNYQYYWPLQSQYFFFADESCCCCQNPVFRHFKKFYQHPITKHAGLLLMFAIFNIIVPSADFITDILTAKSFFQTGHLQPGWLTLLFVFWPFFGRLLVFIAKCFFGKLDYTLYPSKKTKCIVLCRRSPELIWHFPPLIIVR